MGSDSREAFWKVKSLAEMSFSEWESLCDDCGRCCLQKLEDAESGEIFYTDLACKQYDLEKGGCRNYKNRQNLVAACIKLGAEDVAQFHWLPSSCAYRLVAEGSALPEWHPLRSGYSLSVREAGVSIVGNAISEELFPEDEWEERIIQWVE